LQEDIRILAEFIMSEGIVGSNILITGGTGLIGSITAKAFCMANKLFHLENSVFVLVRNTKKADMIFERDKEFNLEYVKGDISSDFCNENYDYIIHTASPTTSSFFMQHPTEVLDINYSGTKNILNLAMRSKSKGIVCLSSMEAFGVITDTDKKLSEKELGYIDISNIRSCYSEGKRVMELMCKCYASEYNIPVKVARLAQTFGAGILPTENRVFAQFARSAYKGENIVLHTNGESVGNYCYTRDAIKAIIRIMLKGQNGEVYTVVNENNSMTIREMAEMVAANFSGGRSKVVFDIHEDNKFGYAPSTKMRLSAAKLSGLQWKPEVGIYDMYLRMMPYL
jgi:nucleoside-diphosphate-sugar epimerase